MWPQTRLQAQIEDQASAKRPEEKLSVGEKAIPEKDWKEAEAIVQQCENHKGFPSKYEEAQEKVQGEAESRPQNQSGD